MKQKKKIIRKFIGYYKPHKALFFFDMFCAFMIASIDLAFPMISRYILQDLLPNERYNVFFIFILVLIGIYILRGIFEYIVNYWGHVLGVRIEYDMRNDLFLHLQKLPFKFYDKNKTGSLMSRVVNDLFEITELAHHGPEDIFLSTLMLGGSFIILLTINWKLTLILYVVVVILVWFAISQRKKLSQGFREVKRKTANINSTLENSLSGIRVAKAFANEDFEVSKFKKGNDAFRGSKKYAYKRMGIFMGGMHFMIHILNVIAIGVGGYFIMVGQMSHGDLLAFILYINSFLQPIRKLTNFVQQFESGMTGFERFVEIMEIDPSITDSKNAIDIQEVKGNIEFKKVSFAYTEEEQVLNELDLHIQSGETVALVGPSGGGKTTICQLIPRFYDVNEGAIQVDGKNIKDIKMNSLRRNIGIVQQDVFLFSGTIKENIAYGKINATDNEIIEAAKKAEIHDFIMSLPKGYETEVGDRGIRLSGGQKQRISIARVFLKNPPILILDEATSALDNETEIKIQNALEKLAKGRTTLVIAHRLSTIKNADRIVVMTQEGIKEQGSHEELIKTEGIYSKLYNAQFKGFIPDEI
ncbi:ATP-binding cassette subfamily B protein [Natranaerovirga hydrolytica]|uniref:ATP-binding cassette subfamily B protein n=1 Tax=Natranaerovirga hydrolytica TaxID=680378 RepID=A0A4R1MR47_9FIRM|nr:ABC transporter ATP-binding protein [Natranaerovirga hydrolytica]TCK92363.1 ATP-binding cassette subfamily B protein [Natranaerovirga hydrolytica]